MQSERKRILTLLENGTITAQEAILLLEALENKTATNTSTGANFTKSSQTEMNQQVEQSQPEREQKQTNYDDFFEKKKNQNNSHLNKNLLQSKNSLKKLNKISRNLVQSLWTS